MDRSDAINWLIAAGLALDVRPGAAIRAVCGSCLRTWASAALHDLRTIVEPTREARLFALFAHHLSRVVEA
jgi:hypothetical protein